jgi:hypothetical protein
LARKISISFKETSKDIELYNIIANMEDKSVELKQILRGALIKGSVKKKEVKSEEAKQDQEDVNILDF